jgi:hypothetical protein
MQSIHQGQKESRMRKKTCFITSLVVSAVLSSGVPAFAADVTGILVDKACYEFSKENITNAHKDMGETCAQDCARKGVQVAIVTKTGELFQVMPTGGLAGENNAKLVPHMGHTVTLSGSVANGAAGKPKILRASALKMVSQ